MSRGAVAVNVADRPLQLALSPLNDTPTTALFRGMLQRTTVQHATHCALLLWISLCAIIFSP